MTVESLHIYSGMHLYFPGGQQPSQQAVAGRYCRLIKGNHARFYSLCPFMLLSFFYIYNLRKLRIQPAARFRLSISVARQALDKHNSLIAHKMVLGFTHYQDPCTPVAPSHPLTLSLSSVKNPDRPQEKNLSSSSSCWACQTCKTSSGQCRSMLYRWPRLWRGVPKLFPLKSCQPSKTGASPRAPPFGELLPDVAG